VEILQEVARVLEVQHEFLARESLRMYLEKELRNIEAAIFKIVTRHGVKSLFELDDKLKQGKIKEEDIIDDFMELDFLESKKDKILRALEKLQ